jgi:hypothetical protein
MCWQARGLVDWWPKVLTGGFPGEPGEETTPSLVFPSLPALQPEASKRTKAQDPPDGEP